MRVKGKTHHHQYLSLSNAGCSSAAAVTLSVWTCVQSTAVQCHSHQKMPLLCGQGASLLACTSITTALLHCVAACLHCCKTVVTLLLSAITCSDLTHSKLLYAMDIIILVQFTSAWVNRLKWKCHTVNSKHNKSNYAHYCSWQKKSYFRFS